MKKKMSCALFFVIAILLTMPLSAGGTKAATAADSNVLKIAIFEGGFGRYYWDSIVSQFQAANPGIRVEMQIDPEIGNLLATQIAVGNWPDIIQLSDGERSGVVASMIQNKEFLDITDIFDGPAPDRQGTKLRDIIVPGMLESTKFAPYGNGRIHLAPLAVGPMGMVYNRTLFEQKGWKLPNTWAEFFALDAELAKPENFVNVNGQMERRRLFTYQGIYAGYLESIFWPAIASAGGMSAINKIQAYEQGSFDNAAVREVVQTFARIGQGFLMDGTVALNHTQSQTDMMLGKALFMPNGTWMEGEMADAPRENGFAFGLIPPPVLRAGQDHYVLSSYEPIGIPRQAKNPELAKKFIQFLYSQQSILAFARLANGTIAVNNAREIAKNDLSSGVYGMFNAYDTGKFFLFAYNPAPAGSRVNLGSVVYDDNMGPLITGSLSVDAYIRRVEEAFAEVRSSR